MEHIASGSKYSIILPTYEERENIPIITWLIFDMAEKNNLGKIITYLECILEIYL